MIVPVLLRARSRFGADQRNADDFWIRLRVSGRSCERGQRLEIAGQDRSCAVAVDDVKENICRLALQLFFDLAHRVRVRAARVQQRHAAVTADVSVLPAINFHQDIAQIAGLSGREERRDHFLDWQLMRTGQHKPWRALLQEKLLERSQLVQHRLLNRGRQLPEEAFEPLDDVKKKRLVHTRSPSQLRSFGTIARNVAQLCRKSFPTAREPPYKRLMSLNVEVLSRAANEARGLAMDAVQASKSGHLGSAAGLRGNRRGSLRPCPEAITPIEPRWIGRDYFILSAGHGSMLLYAWLHLSGHDVPMEEIKRFRQLHSKTPGHPEFFETPGVECTTGPLGQGVGNAVGVAVAAKMAAARFNTPEHQIFDQHVICLAGDGCLAGRRLGGSERLRRALWAWII